MKPNDHVHTVDDGRGLERTVLLNGTQVKAVYADTKRGVVRVYREPLTTDKRGKRLLLKTLYGRVEVLGG